MSVTGHPDPERILQHARAGDAAALGRLFERYRRYLALLARVQIGRRLQGKVDASDLVQETFLQAQRNFQTFHGKTEAEWVAWLREILASRIAKMIRRYFGTQFRNVRLEQQLTDELHGSSFRLSRGLVGDYTSPSQQAARREQAVLLADRLEQLSSDYREVIILRHLEGLTFPEVSRRMGRSVEAVKKLWIRALARLRRSLEGTT